MATKAPGLSGAGILNAATPVPKGPSAQKPMKKVKKAKAVVKAVPKTPAVTSGPGAIGNAGTPGMVNGTNMGVPGTVR